MFFEQIGSKSYFENRAFKKIGKGAFFQGSEYSLKTRSYWELSKDWLKMIETKEFQ